MYLIIFQHFSNQLTNIISYRTKYSDTGRNKIIIQDLTKEKIHSTKGFWLKGGVPRVMISTSAFHARVRGSFPVLGGLKKTIMFLLHPLVKLSILGSLRDREVAFSASDRQGLNIESCVWRAVSSNSSHHPPEILLAQFNLYVHKRGLKPDSFHFILVEN